MVTTLLLAFLVLGLAVVCLGIGYLLTGRSRLKKRCGYSFNQKGTESCPLCHDHKKGKENKNDDGTVCG